MTSAAPDYAEGPRVRPVPWLMNDATRLFVLNLVGLAAIVLGYVEVSGTARLSRQFGWTSFAIGGFIVASAGNVLWLLAGRRAVGERLERLLAARAASARPVFGDPTTAGLPLVTEALVSGPGMVRYHVTSCLLVRDKDVAPATLTSHQRAGRQPCEVCRP